MMNIDDDYSSDEYESEPEYVNKTLLSDNLTESELEELRAKDLKSYDNKGWRINGWIWTTYEDTMNDFKFFNSNKKYFCQYCRGEIRYVHKIIHPNKEHSKAYVGCKCAYKICDNNDKIICPCDKKPIDHRRYY